MQTVYCSTPKGVRLNREQIAALVTMPEQQFQEWCLALERMRHVYTQNTVNKLNAAYKGETHA